MKENYEVRAIPYEQIVPWLLYKHYAHRVPSITWAFGLYRQKELVGVVSYGTPASPSLCIGVAGVENAGKVVELNRLVIEEGQEKNCASLLVGKSLKLLPKPKIVVSYADSGHNHVGKVYQATNWLYTGATQERTDVDTGENKHSRHYQGMDMSKRKIRTSKHRYVYLLGVENSALKYKIVPYPKGESTRYDSGAKLPKQTLMF